MERAICRLHELEAQHTAVCLYPIGKKIADELHKAGYTTEDDFLHLGEKPSYEELSASPEN